MGKLGLTDCQKQIEIPEGACLLLADHFSDPLIYADQFELSPAAIGDVRNSLKDSTRVGMMTALKLWIRKNPIGATLGQLLEIVFTLEKGDTALKCANLIVGTVGKINTV